MAEQVPFIGREDELSLIKELVSVWNSLHIVFIDGEGGIGKTRLLEEIYQQYKAEQSKLTVTKAIDFDDLSFHVAENLGTEIAHLLGEKHYFDLFRKNMLDYRKMEMAEVSHEQLAKGFENGTQSFINCFNNLSEEKRIILLFDTIEKIQKADYIQYLTTTFSKLKNCLILMAGRNAKKIGKQFQRENKDSIHIISLSPLDHKQGRKYFEIKKKQLNTKFPSDLADTIIESSGGKPILIDLAIDWLSRDIPPDWLINYSKENHETHKDDFEGKLVCHIVQNRTEIDKLILLMAHVYPINSEIICKLLNKSEPEALKLIEEIKKYVFVKSLTGNRLTLHDEMRRMVNAYTWPEADPECLRRKQYSNMFIDYINKKIESYNTEIQYLEIERKKSLKNDCVQDEIKAFSRQMALEQDIWLFRIEHLRHALFIDTKKGFNTFIDAFDEATRQSRLNYREMLLVHIQDHNKNLFTDQQLYELDIRRIENWQYKGRYQEAKLIANTLKNIKISIEQEIDLLLMTGNIQIRLGNLKEGIGNFIDAKNICTNNKLGEKDDASKKYVMRTQLALGWGYRLIGKYKEAITEYDKAMDICDDLSDSKFEEGRIINNLAFVHARNGNPSGAFNLAEQAKEIWEEISNKEGMGALYHVYSEIYRVKSDFEKAVEYCETALDIFKEMDHLDWIRRLYSVLGTYHWGQSIINIYVKKDIKLTEKNLKNAEKALQNVIDLSNSDDHHKMTALHYLGHVYLTKYNIYKEKYFIEKAQGYFEDSYKISKEASFNVIELNSLGDLIQIAEKKGEYEKISDLEKAYDDYKERWEEHPKYFNGLLLKYLGDLYLTDVHPDLHKIYACYLKAIPLIALYESQGPYYLIIRLKDIQKRLKNEMEELKNVKIKLGKELSELWKEPEYANHPEAPRYFKKWKKGENLNA